MNPPFTLDDQIKCVTREIEMRKRVYRKRLLEGKMAQAAADFEIGCMVAILQTLSKIEQPELL
jgi:hypothetical protein